VDLFDDCCERIDEAYRELGHELGWRFLTSPQSTFPPSSGILLLTLNPGGPRPRPDHDGPSVEAGSAYLVETWEPPYLAGRAPLQIQVQRLFHALASEWPAHGNGPALLNRSLGGYFVPFRSSSLASLRRKAASLDFAESLWSRILEAFSPSLVITIDHETTTRLRSVLERCDKPLKDERKYPTGWGNVSAGVAAPETRGPAVLRLPHLSRYRLFGRPASQPYMDVIVRAAAQHLAI